MLIFQISFQHGDLTAGILGLDIKVRVAQGPLRV